MKRSILLLFVLVTFMGCEETALQEESVVKKITINASVKGVGGVIDPVGITSITAGDGVTYKIYPTKGHNLYSVFVDGVDKTSEVIDDAFNLKKAFSSKNIEFEFIHQDKLNIQNEYWNLKALQQYLDGVLVVDAVLAEEQLTDKYFFYPNGKTIAYHINGIPFGGPFDWDYFENPTKSIKINQTVFSITEITATSFSYRTSEVTPSGGILESVHTYCKK